MSSTIGSTRSSNGLLPVPAWNVRVMISEQWTDGGINVPVDPAKPNSEELFLHHDQLAAEEFVAVGRGATSIVNERVSVYAFYIQAIEGTNAHKVDHRFWTGVSYGVGAH